MPSFVRIGQETLEELGHKVTKNCTIGSRLIAIIMENWAPKKLKSPFRIPLEVYALEEQII